RRTLAGKSPFAPDKKHLHHRLLELGHSHPRAVLLMYLWAAIISFAAVSLSIFDAPAIVLSVTTLVAICAVGLITLPRLRRRARRRAGPGAVAVTERDGASEKKCFSALDQPWKPVKSREPGVNSGRSRRVTEQTSERETRWRGRSGGR